MVNKKKLIVFIFLTIILLAGAEIYWFNFLQENFGSRNTERKHSACLINDEIANYSMAGKNQKQQEANRDYFATSPVTIFIKDRKSGEEKYKFQIQDNSEGFYTLQLFKCNIYITRIFNFDKAKGVPLSDYKTELWQYNYNDEGENFLILFKEEGAPDNYGQGFRISPFENYIVLEQKYPGDPNHALIIKDLKTKQDIFVLSAKEITKQYSNVVGSFGLDKWTGDGRYFWGDIFEGAYVNGYFRIDTSNWKVDIYEAPDGAMGGSKLNINTGYLPIQPGQIWTGDIEFDEINRERLLKEGKKSEFYLYNLFTKEKIFIISHADDPLWWFKPDWLSDTELQYELPSGEKKIYKIEK